MGTPDRRARIPRGRYTKKFSLERGHPGLEAGGLLRASAARAAFAQVDRRGTGLAAAAKADELVRVVTLVLDGAQARQRRPLVADGAAAHQAAVGRPAVAVALGRPLRDVADEVRDALGRIARRDAAPTLTRTATTLRTSPSSRTRLRRPSPLKMS
jgi:hypothetical protein